MTAYMSNLIDLLFWHYLILFTHFSIDLVGGIISVIVIYILLS